MPHTDYVVSLALAKCSMGTLPLPLPVTSQPLHLVGGLAVATELDLAPLVNIPCFGICQQLTKLASGVPTPCVPVPTGWKGANPARKIMGLKPLLEKATCQCALGGTVSFQNSGQFGPAKFQTGPNFIMLTAGNKGGWNEELNKPLEPNHEYLVDNYLYTTDADRRVVKVRGDLEPEKKERNKAEQLIAGKPPVDGGVKDGNRGDQGGHLIACIFNGPGEQINYLPMTEHLNKSGWKRMENAWARELKKTPPSKVDVEIHAVFDVDKRPIEFIVNYTINGIDQQPLKFKN